jgi:hypothetical protein
MESTHSLKASLTETGQALRGDVRRNFMARTFKEQGAWGKRHSACELGWNHATFRKSTHELEGDSRVSMSSRPVITSVPKPTCRSCANTDGDTLSRTTDAG